jgi:outer membrane receptor protein involved in Fe transport
MKKLISILAIICFAQITFGQGTPAAEKKPRTELERPTLATENTAKGNSKIMGFMVDSLLTQAVEFANIALINKTTNKPVDGTMADDKGKFMLSRVPVGSYKLLVSFLGYSDKTIDNLTITKGQDLDLGVIRLSQNIKTLAEVTVNGQKALVEEKVDRLVYNADKDLTARGGDAADVLRKVPMLSVDLEGNVSLQGNANVKVLINNKPSSIMASSIADALKQIPADMIKTVEVITSPSAKYDAEGSGGIINIITKKNTLEGLTLSVDSGLGNRSSTLGLTGNYRKGKLGMTLGGNGRAFYNPSLNTIEQTTTLNSNVLRTSQRADAYDKGLFGQYNLGLDYDISKNQSLTANARFGIRNFARSQTLITNSFVNEIASGISGRNLNTKDLSNSIDLNLDYLYTYGNGKEWTVSTQYSKNNLTNNFDATLLNAYSELTGGQKNINLNTNTEATVQTDYVMPIAKNQSFEIGAKAISREVNSNYEYLFANSAALNYSTDAKRPSGSLNYTQNIAATYFSYTYATANKYTLKAGLRYEYTDITAKSQDNSPILIPAYGVLVPSLNISKKVTDNTTIKLAYNRRIQRPGLQQLNPNFNAANPLNISYGNPNLTPEFSDKVELGFSSFIKKNYLNVVLFARLNTDDIQQVSQRSDTLAGAITTTFKNLGLENNFGANIFGTINITPKWSINANLDVFYRYLEGQAPDLTGQSVLVKNSGWSFGGRVDMQAQLGNGWALQLNGGGRGAMVGLQGTRSGMAMYSLGLRKESKDKTMSIGLAAENFLTNGMVFKSTLNSTQFNQVNTNYIYNSSVRLTFSYKIGKMSFAASKPKTKSVNNDDVKN